MVQQQQQPLIFGTLIKRYKRFMADILLDSGIEITAHCPNSGKLLGVPEGSRVLVTDHGEGGTRKLRYTWQWFQDGSIWVSINTHEANRIVERFLEARLIPEFVEFDAIKREVNYGEKSRVDFLLSKGDKRLFLEVKTIHYKRGDCGYFPDCPTLRGVKHMQQLGKVIDPQTRAAVLYLIQRNDCRHYAYAADIDPLYAAEATAARVKGVEFYAYSLNLTPGYAPELAERIEPQTL